MGVTAGYRSTQICHRARGLLSKAAGHTIRTFYRYAGITPSKSAAALYHTLLFDVSLPLGLPPPPPGPHEISIPAGPFSCCKKKCPTLPSFESEVVCTRKYGFRTLQDKIVDRNRRLHITRSSPGCGGKVLCPKVQRRKKYGTRAACWYWYCCELFLTKTSVDGLP